MPESSRIADNRGTDAQSDMSTVFETSNVDVADGELEHTSTPRGAPARGRSRDRSCGLRRLSPEADQRYCLWSNRRVDADADGRADRSGHGLPHDDRFHRRDQSERPRRNVFNGDDVQLRGRGQSSPPTHRPAMHRPTTTLRLSEYNGRTHLHTHILKYFNAKKINDWDDDVGVAHLKNSLIDDASCVLWSLPIDCTEKTLIDALYERFGNQRQVDHLKYQFKNRKQNKGETIDDYFAAVVKLAQLAYPEQDGALIQSLTCDKFVDGLYDANIRMKLLESNHKSIHIACQHALRLQTIAESYCDDRRFTRTVNVKPETDLMALNMSKIEARLDRLAASVEMLSRSQAGLDRRSDDRVGDRQVTECGSNRPTVDAGKSKFAPRDQKSARVRRCFRCDSDTHLLRSCPYKDKAPPPAASTSKTQQIETPIDDQHYVAGCLIKSKKNWRVDYIFDSGSQISLMPERYLKFAYSRLKPSRINASAATGDKINILGSAVFKLRIGDVVFSTECLVSSDIGDILLGCDFMRANSVVLDIANNMATVKGVNIKLSRRQQHAKVRRIVLAETVHILGNHSMQAPVKLLYNSPQDSPCEWIAENAISNKVAWSPRALMSHRVHAVLPITNVSDEVVILKKGDLISQASPRLTQNELVPPNSMRNFTVRLVNDDTKHEPSIDTSVEERVSDKNSAPIKPLADDSITGVLPIDSLHDMNMSLYLALSEHERAMIDKIVERVDSSISLHDRDRLRILLSKHINTFAKHRMDCGLAKDFEHRVPLRDRNAPPVTAKCRSYPPGIQKVIDDQISEWLRYDIIEPSNSLWSSPLLTVAKKTPPGSAPAWRVVIDLRSVNNACFRSQIPLHNMHETIHNLAAAKYVSKLDLTQSFHCLGVEKESRQVFAFRSKNRIWQFKRIPYGYLSGSQLLCEMLNKLLSSIADPAIFAYIDDTFIVMENFDQGLLSLAKLLSAFERNGIRANPDKTFLFVRDFEALGWRFSGQTITITPQRRNAILKMKFPRTLRQIRAITGALQFLRDSVPNLAYYLAPFADALKKNAPKWEENEINRLAFQRLIHHVANCADRNIFRYDLPALINTDSNDHYFAGTLSNIYPDGSIKVCSFYSGRFARSFSNYCILRKEICALLFTLRRYRDLILGSKIFLQTDSSVASLLLKSKNLSPQLVRMAQELAEYNLTISHVSNRQNLLADILTRQTSESEYLKNYSTPCSFDNLCRRCRPAKKYADDVSIDENNDDDDDDGMVVDVGDGRSGTSIAVNSIDSIKLTDVHVTSEVLTFLDNLIPVHASRYVAANDCSDSKQSVTYINSSVNNCTDNVHANVANVLTDVERSDACVAVKADVIPTGRFNANELVFKTVTITEDLGGPTLHGKSRDTSVRTLDFKPCGVDLGGDSSSNGKHCTLVPAAGAHSNANTSVTAARGELGALAACNGPSVLIGAENADGNICTETFTASNGRLMPFTTGHLHINAACNVVVDSIVNCDSNGSYERPISTENNDVSYSPSIRPPVVTNVQRRDESVAATCYSVQNSRTCNSNIPATRCDSHGTGDGHESYLNDQNGQQRHQQQKLTLNGHSSRQRRRRRAECDASKFTTDRLADNTIAALCALPPTSCSGSDGSTAQRESRPIIDITHDTSTDRRMDKMADDETRVCAVTRQQARQNKETKNKNNALQLMPVCDENIVWSIDYLREQQRNDPTLALLYDNLANGTEISNQQFDEDAELYYYYCQKNALILKNGIIFRQFYDDAGNVKHTQYLAGKHIRPIILKRIHAFELCHRRTLAVNIDKLMKCAWWQRYKTDMKLYVQGCIVCLENFSRKELGKYTISNLQHACAPNVILSIDICGGFPITKSGHRFILTTLDEFSRRAHFFALKSREAEEIAKHILSVYLNDGMYACVRYDNARENVGHIMTSLNALMNIKRIEIPPYSPRANSKIEKMHAALNKAMTASLRDYNSWPELLPYLQAMYNSTYSTVLKCTPDFLHRGRDVNSFTSALLAIPQQVYRTHGEFAAKIASNLQTAFEMCNQHLKKAAEMSKTYYNRLKKVPNFEINDSVLVYSPRTPKNRPFKWHRHFARHATIIKKLSAVYFVVKFHNSSKTQTVYADKLLKIPPDYVAE